VVVRNADDQPVGTVSWHEVHHGPNPESTAWNIGIELVPEARGQGMGSEAQRLLARHLFATTPVQRVEATTDVQNAAEQGALARAGFTREGVLRGAQFRASQWHDVVVWSVLRGEV
jgi:RimJ/RimL family protein N-acetyltransferase